MKYWSTGWCESEEEMLEVGRMGGMLLSWAIAQNLVSDEFIAQNGELLTQVHERDLVDGAFFDEISSKACDGKICDYDLNETGNRFFAAYLNMYKNTFLDDVSKVLGVPLPADDSWEQYDRLASAIDMRFAAWRD